MDFELMQQKHLRTGKTRCIRALPGAPPNWESSKKKCCWGTFHQPFPYDSQLTAAKDNSITHAAAAASNLEAATPMRSAETELQNTIELCAMVSEIAAPKPDLDAKAEKKRF